MPNGYFKAHLEGHLMVCTGEKGAVLSTFDCGTVEEAQSRMSVLVEADSWSGTPYHHMARLKGKGVDCAQILDLVYGNCGVIPYQVIEKYPPDWHMHQGNERYMDYVKKNATPTTEPKPADIAMWQFGRAYAHGAIIMEPGFPHIFHALKEWKMASHGLGNEGSLFKKEPIFFNPWIKPTPE